MPHPTVLDNSGDVWKTLDAALLSFDAVLTKLSPLAGESDRSGAVDGANLQSSCSNDLSTHNEWMRGAGEAGKPGRSMLTASAGSSGCCEDGGDDHTLHLSFSSQSSLGYRSSSNSSDDALLSSSYCSSRDGSDDSTTGPLLVSAQSPGEVTPDVGVKSYSPAGSVHSPQGHSKGNTFVGAAGHAMLKLPRDKPQAHHGEKPAATRPSMIPRAAAVCTISEEDFERVLRSTQKAEILSAADLETRLQTIEVVLANSAESWERRIDALKGLRQLTLAAGPNSAELAAHLRGLAIGFQLSLADTRSQVIREACLTVGFLAQLLESRLEPLAEIIFHQLINLVLSSAAVVATAGGIALRFVIRLVCSPRMLSLLIQQTSSKASQIRRQVSDLLELVVVSWPQGTIEKCEDKLRDACRKGAESDSDSHVREACIRVMGKLASRARPVADVHTIRADSPCRITDARQSSGKNTPSSKSSSSRTTSATNGASSPVPGYKDCVLRQNPATIRGSGDSSSRNSPALSSSSSVHGLQTPRKGLLKAAELAERRRKTDLTSTAELAMASSEAGQQMQHNNIGTHGTSTGLYSASPVSSYAREASHHRSPLLLTGSLGFRERHPSTQSHDSAERASSSAAAAAAWSESGKDSGAGTADECDGDDDDGPASDVSSVSSEAFEVGQHGASAGAAASALLHATADIGEVLANVSSPLWAARRRGLLQLQRFVADQRSLNAGELKRVTDLFTRMFQDPDLKVYGTFLDTLVDVVRVHPHDLSGWLPTLLSKLLLVNHRRSKRLASITSKVQRALRAVRASFDNAVQFHAVCGLLADAGQSMGVQEKLRTLQFLLALVRQMDPTDFNARHDTDVLSRMFEQLVLASGEVKSAGIRKMAPELLASLFEQNAPEFSYVLSRSPGAVQAAVRTVLHAHMQNALTASAASVSHTVDGGGSSSSQPASPANISVQTGQQWELRSSSCLDRGSLHRSAALQEPGLAVSDQHTVIHTSGRQNKFTGPGLPDSDRAVICLSNDSGIQGSPTDLNCLSPSSRGPDVSAADDGSKRVIGAPIQGLQTKPQEAGDIPDGSKKSFSSRIQSQLPDVVNHASTGDHNKSNFHVGAQSAQGTGVTHRHLSGGSNESDPEDVTGVNDSSLLQVVQSTSELDFRELCALSSYVKDKGLGVFEEFFEPLVWKTLRAFQNASLEGTAAAEELLDTIAAAANPEQLLKIICKASQSNDSSVTLAAIRTESKIIQQLTEDVAERNVHMMLPGLLQGFNHTESAMRKASVLALVELHAHLGDTLVQDHLAASLNSSQIKLLGVYIQRTTVKTKPAA